MRGARLFSVRGPGHFGADHDSIVSSRTGAESNNHSLFTPWQSRIAFATDMFSNSDRLQLACCSVFVKTFIVQYNCLSGNSVSDSCHTVHRLYTCCIILGALQQQSDAQGGESRDTIQVVCPPIGAEEGMGPHTLCAKAPGRAATCSLRTMLPVFTTSPTDVIMTVCDAQPSWTLDSHCTVLTHLNRDKKPTYYGACTG